MSDKQLKPPRIEFINEPDPCGKGLYMVGIVMSGVPKRFTKMTLGFMQEAINDQIVRLMGKIAMDEMDAKRRKEKTQ